MGHVRCCVFAVKGRPADCGLRTHATNTRSNATQRPGHETSTARSVGIASASDRHWNADSHFSVSEVRSSAWAIPSTSRCPLCRGIREGGDPVPLSTRLPAAPHQAFFWKPVSDVTLTAACGPPQGGTSRVSPRLLRFFHLLHIPELSEDTLRRVFGLILNGFLERFAPEVLSPLPPPWRLPPALCAGCDPTQGTWPLGHLPLRVPVPVGTYPRGYLPL